MDIRANVDEDKRPYFVLDIGDVPGYLFRRALDDGPREDRRDGKSMAIQERNLR
jgi:hypothetical protein